MTAGSCVFVWAGIGKPFIEHDNAMPVYFPRPVLSFSRCRDDGTLVHARTTVDVQPGAKV
jgi:hypothetical protein